MLADIRDEEKTHMGELLTLLKYLDPKEGDLYANGEKEVLEMLEELGIKPADVPAINGSTVGSLKEEK